MDVLISVLMKTPIYIYMRSLIIKDKEKNDLLSSLFVISVSFFLSSFFITYSLFNDIFMMVTLLTFLKLWGVFKYMESRKT